MKIDTKEISLNGVLYVEKSLIEQPKPVDTSGMTWCIIRSRNQGVMYGLVDKPLAVTSQCVTVYRPRQIWAWNSSFVLVDLAEYGPKDAAQMKMSCEGSQPTRMLEACGIIVCREVAAMRLSAVPATVK